MYGCMDVWMYGCMDVWMYGCMDVWMFGCMLACRYNRSMRLKKRCPALKKKKKKKVLCMRIL